MSKPWAVRGEDGKFHLTPEEAEECRCWREKAAKDWAEYLRRQKNGTSGISKSSTDRD